MSDRIAVHREGEIMAIEFDNLAKVAQKYVADCPVIVLGTGGNHPPRASIDVILLTSDVVSRKPIIHFFHDGP